MGIGPWRTLAIAATAALVVVSAGWLMTAVRDAQVPAQSSAEVGFVRDTVTHYEQAVVMSILVKEGTDDPIVAVLLAQRR